LSQACSVRDGILVDTTRSGLISMRNSILDLIRMHLCRDADQVNPPTSANLQITQPFQTRYTSPAEELVLEIDAMDLFRHIGITDFGMRGCYKPSEGKIYLVKNKWCLETLIHETLHACSINSKDPELTRYDQLFDGLTEFYTGYLLFHEFNECYTNCFMPAGQLCEMVYDPYTKLWATLCHFISLRNTLGIYFPTDNLWDDEVDTFVQRINDLGFPKFSRPFGRAGPGSVTRFEMICNDAFDGYAEISKKKNRFIDYNYIIDT